jgi:hypothetical protein
MGAEEIEIWLNHFEQQALHPRSVPCGLSDVLRPDERDLIASSIATFQLGEQSEGQTFLRAAKRCAQEKQLPHLLRIVELLIREQRHHASLLRGFMQDHQMPLKRADWTDHIFRLIRRLAGLQLGFESQLLFALRAGRSARSRAWARHAHGVFFAITAMVVWLTHRSVLRRAGHGGRSFLRACRVQYTFYLEPTGLRSFSSTAPRLSPMWVLRATRE